MLQCTMEVETRVELYQVKECVVQYVTNCTLYSTVHGMSNIKSFIMSKLSVRITDKSWSLIDITKSIVERALFATMAAYASRVILHSRSYPSNRLAKYWFQSYNSIRRCTGM